MRYLRIYLERIEICVGQVISTPLIDMQAERERVRERERESVQGRTIESDWEKEERLWWGIREKYREATLNNAVDPMD